MTPIKHKHCIIGAGFSGLPIAKRLKELGEDFDVLDKNTGVGGLWHNGMYETVRLISSRRTTGYRDFPMPEHYPDFPNREQMRAYFEAYAKHFELMPHIQLNTEVTRIAPAPDYQSNLNWQVELANGEVRTYRTVIIASGHHSISKPFQAPGHFQGEIILADQYRQPDIFAGKRVLVVGNGNTACDAVVEAAKVATAAEISMRHGTYIVPKKILSFPIVDWTYSPIQFDWSDRLFAWLVSGLAGGHPWMYGAPKPRGRILDQHPVLNSRFLQFVHTKRFKIRAEIQRLEGQTVYFTDGTCSDYDLIFSATGYQILLPMLRPEDHLLSWEGEFPLLYFRFLNPDWRGLFFAGIGQARTGGGPLFEAGGSMIARMAAYDAKSLSGIRAALEQHPAFRAIKFFGYKPIYPADLRSQGKGELNLQISAFQQILDDIGCPNTPSRKGLLQAGIKT